MTLREYVESWRPTLKLYFKSFLNYPNRGWAFCTLRVLWQFISGYKGRA
jgi:hypothetical protein